MYYNSISKGYDELYEEEQKKKLDLVKENLEIKKTDKLLDVGCGTGISSNFYCDVTGIDPSEKLLKIAEKKFPNIQFLQAEAEELPFEDNHFDVVISLTVIHNFNDVDLGLKEIKRVGKDRFVLSVLKKSEKFNDISYKIENMFKIIKKIEDEKDMIFILTKII